MLGLGVKFRKRVTGMLAGTLVALAATFAFPWALAGQTSPSDADSATAKNSADKAKLSEATRASTDEAVRRAAREKAGKSREKATAKDSSRDDTQGAIELQPISKDSREAEAEESSKDSRKPAARNIHGSIRGAAGAGTTRVGTELGASSKTGKTHVYVETEQKRSETPTPH